MKKHLFTLIATLLCTGMLRAQDVIVTPDILRQGGGPWACLTIDTLNNGYKLSNEINEDRIIVERVEGKYYIICGADSLFLDGPSSLKIDLPPESGIALHEKEISSYRRPTSQTNMTIPRPFVLVRGHNNRHSWVFNLVDKTDNRVLERVTVMREWPSEPPAITLFFNQADNLSLLRDSILTIPCDSCIYYSARQDLVLSKMRIEKVPDARFIKLNSVTINNNPSPLTLYKGAATLANDSEDSYSSMYFAETTTIGQNLGSINSIKVNYSYLDNELREISQTSEHHIKQVPGGGEDSLIASSGVLLGLMLFFALLLVAIAPSRNKMIAEVRNNESNKVPDIPKQSVATQNTDATKAKQKTPPTNKRIDDSVKKEFDRILSTIDRVFGPRKNNETYTQFLERKGRQLLSLKYAADAAFGRPAEGETYESFFSKISKKKDNIDLIDLLIRQYFGPIPKGMKYPDVFQKIKYKYEDDSRALKKLQNDIRTILGDPEPGQDYSQLVRQRFNELISMPILIDTYFGVGKDGEGYETIIKTKAERLSALEELDRATKEVFGQPNERESSSDLLRRSVQSLKQRLEDEQQSLEDEKRSVRQKLDAQKQELEIEHTKDKDRILEKLQSMTASQQVNTRDLCSSQLAILDRMRRSYNVCIKYISSGSKVGEYTKHFGISLMSFIESAESIYKNDEEKENTTSLSEKMSPLIQKALNDHTSWLNALSRLEAYARTEVLRKYMLRGGIHLSALTDLYYAVQEFLFNNRYILNTLPELFIDCDNIDDYICDNMDIVISNIFDYEEEIQDSAIVDIIKIGYSYKDKPVNKTTVAYYSKPKA